MKALERSLPLVLGQWEPLKNFTQGHGKDRGSGWEDGVWASREAVAGERSTWISEIFGREFQQGFLMDWLGRDEEREALG